MSYERFPIRPAGALIRWLLLGILLLVLGLGSCGTVDYGERGVQYLGSGSVPFIQVK